MKPIAGVYAIIQACADRERAEGINVGVLVVAPGLGVATRILAKRGALRRRLVSAGFDAVLFEHEIRGAICRVAHEKLASASDLTAFAAREAGHLLFTAPRPVAVQDLEHVADELYEALVQPIAIVPARVQLPKLDLYFNPLVREGLMQRSPSLDLPLLKKRFTTPFGYANGARNLLKPHAFSAERGHALEAALQIGGRGELVAKQHDDEGLPYKLIVIGAFATPKIASAVDELLQEFNTTLVRAPDLPAFVEEVRRTAH